MAATNTLRIVTSLAIEGDVVPEIKRWLVDLVRNNHTLTIVFVNKTDHALRTGDLASRGIEVRISRYLNSLPSD